MKPKKRQKLCHHCEGEVDLDVIVCPFCAADLREARVEQPRFSSPVIKELPPEQSLYPSTRSLPPPEEEVMVQEEESPVAAQVESQAESTFKSSMGGILLFTLGAHLFFLAMAFLFLSDRGVLLLRFNAHFWPLCLILSLPLLVFGYRFTKNL